jgi:hypothetical protein
LLEKYWWAIALGVLGLIGLTATIWRRFASPASAPKIEKPVIELRDGMSDGEVLSLTLEPTSFSRSIMNATATYRITLRNGGPDALNQMAISADLVCASKDKPLDQQIADAGTDLPDAHQAARLASGQSVRFSGTVQLPLSQVSFFLQGKVAMLIPLLRVRVSAEGMEPVVRTFVIGQAGVDSLSKPQPFRMDEGPRSWSPIAHRTVEAAAKAALD